MKIKEAGRLRTADT